MSGAEANGIALELDRVSVRLRASGRSTLALDDVSMRVPRGSVVGVVGESGSGKSTLARVVAGLQPIDSGSVRVNGEERVGPSQKRRSRIRRDIQMVFQDPGASLDPRMTIEETLAEALGETRGGASASAEIDVLLDQVALSRSTRRLLPSEISGGMQQRVSIARALAARPEVLIADEITSALDVSVQGRILNLLREIHRELNLTILFISHNMAVIRYVCDEIVVIRHGEVIERGEAVRVVDEPAEPYTRSLMAAVPQMPVTVTQRIRLV